MTGLMRLVAPAVAATIATGCVSRAPTAVLVRPSEGIAVRPGAGSGSGSGAGQIEIEAWVCLDGGWLEQIACSPGTREHESLVVIKSRPSDIHAALLLAGYEPGSPGRWIYEQGQVQLTEPTGDPLDVFVRYSHGNRTIEEPIGVWMIDGEDRASFPESHWVFGGSTFAPNPQWMGPGEHYVADQTGSIIGLVTFGDEVIGYQRVIADQEAVEAPQWQVRTEHVPPIGTAVTLILRGPS